MYSAMPKVLNRVLNAKTIATLTKPGTYADGGGLSFRIDDRGYRRWIWRGPGQRQGDCPRGLGGYPAVSLAEAWKAAAGVRADVGAGTLEGAPPAPETVAAIPTFAEGRRKGD